MLTLVAAYLAFGGILFDRPVVADPAAARATTVIEQNLDEGRDATGLFYTDVDGWQTLVVADRAP